MTFFTFQNPSMLLLLALLLPIAWLLRRARHRRKSVIEAMGGDLSQRSIWRDRLCLAATLLLILALARPGMSPQRHSVSKSGRDVVFVLDVSQSMLAEDAYPSRLDAAKDAIRDALDHLHSERVALVVYAGSANILCPLTFDYDFVRYVLDQATPRTVDFGGTTLLSATEKCADSIFTEQRKGMQDLIVLTDGEEHGSHSQRIAKLLNDHATGLLLVGIGDTTAGSRIPITDDEGVTEYLKHDGQFVTTRLNESGLRELARLASGATYVSAGTSAFDLAGLYWQYASEKPISDVGGTDTYVTYRELGFPLMGLALAMLLMAQWKRRLHGRKRTRLTAQANATLFFIAAGGIAPTSPVLAEETGIAAQFAEAVELQTAGRTADALEIYDAIESGMVAGEISAPQTAVLRFNQGLCYLDLAAADADAEPRAALSGAEQAQMCFLDACRMSPDLARARMRLDPTANWITELHQRIEQEDQRQQELQQQLQNLIDLLRELQQKQAKLRQDVPDRPNSQNPRRRNQASPQVEPETATADAKKFSQQQRQLHQEGVAIEAAMQTLDQTMTQSVTPEDTQSLSVLEEPVHLMKQAITAQEMAAEKLQQWSGWPGARDQQQIAIRKIQEILDLLANDSSEDSDEGDWDDEESYEDMMESSESDEAMMSSMQGEGDFASGGEMQPLPVPNYSVDDILMQEQGSLQFRQQQRAKSNQGKVEKDW
ncbi:von Willebrand factor type A [Rhodopirellula maiorica SM1]|uniref:von Willebrand factor type A n=1 Tax=Rhodopirellula maiorica SM1 TaxID=1265738 RepID=M5RLF0_9BACT|nr:VWA domain-containing protein [Rhodopirellula maiorica]EMI20026.1 von Willebrand factor type A [Rhodopirellula maiorica SM1]